MSSADAEHPNAVLVRKLYRHLAAGELAAYFDMLADDAVFHVVSAERRGRSIEMPNFNVYRFEDHLVAERWEFLADPALHDEFWAP